MLTARLMKYKWVDELGEVPHAVLPATGEAVELGDLEEGDLIEFPEGLEVVVDGESFPASLDTIRRAKDRRGIELVCRGQGLSGGKPFHTVYPCDDLEIELFQGKGYYALDNLLKMYGL